MTNKQKMEYYNELAETDKEAAFEFHKQIIRPTTEVKKKVIKRKKSLLQRSNSNKSSNLKSSSRTILTKSSVISKNSHKKKALSTFSGSGM